MIYSRNLLLSCKQMIEKQGYDAAPDRKEAEITTVKRDVKTVRCKDCGLDKRVNGVFLPPRKAIEIRSRSERIELLRLGVYSYMSLTRFGTMRMQMRSRSQGYLLGRVIMSSCRRSSICSRHGR